MKEKIRFVITGLLIGVMLILPAFTASAFTDVAGNAEYAEAAEYLNGLGIMVGDEKGNFNPDNPVTRAEMATIICRMLGETDNLTGSTEFSDVPTDHWANAYVAKASKMGIVNGYGNGLFGPSDNVTYEQGVTMIVRAVGGEIEAEDYGGYPDGFLAVAKKYGLTNGVAGEKGLPLSRADVATIVYNCLA